ncbi:MAG TPA: TIGR04283 family arsenosugar biosynthesis glycosyltransferase [Xanthobacteraceae bacterium]
MPMLSIIVPTLNEAETIVQALTSLQRSRNRNAEIIVVDGGSTDKTMMLARPLCDQFKTARRGRATQMNAGAAAAQGDILLFLHADARLPKCAVDLVRGTLAAGDRVWGRFDVRIDSRHPALRLVAYMMNQRSRLTGIATGDQAMFVCRRNFEAVGGFPDIPLMEDIALSRALRRLGWPVCLSTPVVTSARYWERRGIMSTIFLMWRLRLAYFFGADPADLAIHYGYAPRDD